MDDFNKDYLVIMSPVGSASADGIIEVDVRSFANGSVRFSGPYEIRHSHDFFDAKSFMNCASASAPSTGMAL